jgi:hypothetical protein
MTCPQCEQLRAALRAFVRWLRERAAGDDAAMTAVRYVEALCAGCAPSSLQSVITWIPVSERLPEQYKDVLIWQYAPDQQTFNEMGPHVLVAYYNAAASRWMCFVANNVVGTVTHWAELPPPPASEEGEG